MDLPGLVAALSVGCLVLALGWFKVGSLDVGYHLGYGRHFLDTGRIVGLDPFLWPQTARPFVNANWGSQVLMALVERVAGAPGLVALRLVLIATVFACIAAVVRAHVSGWLAVAAAWMLAALGGYERFSMRPELFSYALMSLQLVILTRGLRYWRSVLVLVVLQVAWVNLHSYFVVGLLLSAAWLAGKAGRLVWHRRGTGPPARGGGRQVRMLAACMLAQVCACAINPWHVRGLAFPFKTLGFLESHQAMGTAAGDPSQSAWSEISEFQSPFSFAGQIINHRTIQAYWVLLGVGSLGVAALVFRGRFAEAFAIVLLFLMSFKMRRNVAQFALLGAPLSVVGLAVLIPWTRLRAPLRRVLGVATAAGLVVLAGWWITAIASGRFYYVERRVSREFGAAYSDRTFPCRAVKWLAAHQTLKPNLFVDYFTSSNTLLWLPDRFKLFVDTNTFAYEDQTLATAFGLGLGRVDHDRFFKQHGMNVVLLHCGPDTQVLTRNMVKDDGRWALVYFDQYDVIFVRRIMEHVPLILENEVSQASLIARQWVDSIGGPAYARAQSLGTAVNVPMSLGWWRPAMVLMDEALRLSPDYYEAWYYLGVCRGNLGNAAARSRDDAEADRQWSLAENCFEKVLALNPDHRDAANFLRATQQRRGMLNRQ